jgi:hypothetical protein
MLTIAIIAAYVIGSYVCIKLTMNGAIIDDSED